MMLQAIRVQFFKPGEILVEQYSADYNLYVIGGGSVNVFQFLDQFNKTYMGYLERGSIINLTAALFNT